MTNKIVKYLVGLFALILINIDSIAQTKPMYSQYMLNMLNLNPAYAGNRNSVNINGIFRSQWVGLPGSPTTESISIDGRLKESNGALGVRLYNDKLGIERSTGIEGYYSYHIPLSYASFDDDSKGEAGTTLSIGLGIGCMNYNAKYSEVITLQPNDPNFMLNVNGFLPTAGFGALLHSYRWYLGISAPDLITGRLNSQNRVDVTGILSKGEIFATAGYIFGKEDDNVKIKPSMLLKMASGAPLEYDFNVNCWLHDIFMFGLSYRTSDAALAMIEFQATPNLRIGYCYDYTVSGLSGYNSGTHELLLRYELKNKAGRGVATPVRYY
jgi:type IX secretion system PorP/SprF family membrane protein